MTASTLSITLLGTFGVTIDTIPLAGFRTDKERALFAYLALASDRPHTRRALAGLLWPEVPEQHSLSSLRVTLYNLRKMLEEAQPTLSEQVFTTTRQTIQLNASAITVDVADFEACIESANSHSHQHIHQCTPCLSQLARAASLYRGSLLAGFSLPDASAFEEWLLLRREQLYVQALLALKTLTDAYEAQGNMENALTYAHRLLELDPFQETTHCTLMRIFARRGLPDRALGQYAMLRKLLHDELDAEPSRQATELYQQIRDGRFEEPASQQRHHTTGEENVATGLREIPVTSALFGRTRESSLLEQWLVQDECRLVEVLGLGGIGKTSLVADVARTVAERFEQVIWCSLLNAPPLDELLSGLLQTLPDQPLAEVPGSVEERISLLLTFLQQQRVLLVLDNLESILNSEEAGRFHADHVDYQQFLERIATREHRSAVVITSRERPEGIYRLTSDMPLVQSLLLSGIGEIPGEGLLAELGISGSTTTLRTLVARYSGNPLALKLVVNTVQESFFGDVDSFLAVDTLIFDDVRRVLDQQVARLTQLERDILYWLAVERKPIDVQTLRQNLVHPPVAHSLMEALRGLQIRCLVERQPAGFTLQNVITEYLTDRLVEGVVQEFLSGNLNLLHRYALLKTQTEFYIRQSQIRMILAPIAAHLEATLGRHTLEDKIRQILAKLRQNAQHLPSYADGNLLNLLLHLQFDITGYDFSCLSVWHADLRGAELHQVKFSGSDLTYSAFSETLSHTYSVAIHPHGSQLATGGTQRQVRLWTFPDCLPAGRLIGHTSEVHSIAFSPDGTLLASASLDHTVRIWNWQTGECLHVLTGHNSYVYTIAFSPNNQLLASGSHDCTVRLWDVHTGEQIGIVTGHTGPVMALDFHPEGNILASGSTDHSIRLWEVTPHTRKEIPGGTDTSLIPLQILHGHSNHIYCISFSPDGTLLASGSADTTIRLWTVADYSPIGSLLGHTNPVRCLVFHPDSKYLYTGAADRTIRIWDVASQHTQQILHGHTHFVRSLDIDPEGHTLVSGSMDHSIRLWNLHTQQADPAIKTIQGHTSALHTISFAPDGTMLAGGDGNGKVRLWSMDELEVQPSTSRVLPGHGIHVRDIDFSPDGTFLASADFDSTVRIWNVANHRLIAKLRGHREDVHVVRFSPDGNLLATAGYEGEILVWSLHDPTRPKLLKTLRGHIWNINAMVFLPNSEFLVSGATDQPIRVWNVASGHCIQKVRLGKGSVMTLSVSSSASLIAAAGWAGILYLFHFDTNGRLHFYASVRIHPDRVYQVAFSPDGKYLASCSNRSVRLWEVGAQQEILSIDTSNQPVVTVAFHPNGSILATGSHDETVRLWQIDYANHSCECIQVVPISGPYEGMDITGATGLNDTQRSTLMALGSIDMG